MVSTKGTAPRAVLMDAGFLTPWISEFACSLRTLAHSDLTIRGYTDSARHFAAWVHDAGLQLDGIGEGAVERFARHQCRCVGGRQWDRVSAKYVKRAGRFVAFLAERGVAATVAPGPAEIVHPQIVDYQRWLSVHRGLSERSVSRQGRMVKRLLVALGTDPQAYSATTIRAAVLAEAQRCSPSHIGTMTSALRGYLRFLAASGLCRPGLDQSRCHLLGSGAGGGARRARHGSLRNRRRPGLAFRRSRVVMVCRHRSCRPGARPRATGAPGRRQGAAPVRSRSRRQTASWLACCLAQAQGMSSSRREAGQRLTSLVRTSVR